MATISLDILIPPDTLPTSQQPLQNIMSRWGRGNFLGGDISLQGSGGGGGGGGGGSGAGLSVFRGRSGGNYVYSVGTPPAGATDVVVIAIT